MLSIGDNHFSDSCSGDNYSADNCSGDIFSLDKLSGADNKCYNKDNIIRFFSQYYALIYQLMTFRLVDLIILNKKKIKNKKKKKKNIN